MIKDMLSVIIPVYNADKYLNKCIDSVLFQTYAGIELIIINDGSTDRSAEIVSGYLSDSRIVYTEQDNAGVSAAMNKGLELANGEYVTFLGNDDYIEPEMYEKMLYALQTSQADMAICDFNLVYEDGRETLSNYSETQNEVVDLRKDLYSYFAKCCVNPRSNNYIWSRVYKSEIIKKSGLRFENLAIGEDTLFNFKLLAYINNVVFMKESFYNYLQRSGSVVHNVAKRKNLAKAYADQFDSLANYYKDNSFDRLSELLPVIAFTRMRSTFFYSRLSGMQDSEIIKCIEENFSGRQIAGYLTGTPVKE